MVQRLAFLLLAASVALLGTFVPAEATLHMRRETNGQRFARGLPPLPPIRRSPTETAHRRQVSPQRSPSVVGRLEVRHATDNTRLGYVANDVSHGPIGLNLDTGHNPDIPDLTVEFSDSTLVAQDPKFHAPYYIGGYGLLPLSPQTLNTIEFINVDAGPDAAIWNLDLTSGALNATWTNPDKSTARPTLIFDSDLNALNFTSDPTALYNFYYQIPVVRLGSLISAILDPFQLTAIFTDYFPLKIDTSPLRLIGFVKLARLIF
ncbi:hypothetical protein EDB83DRAFT_2520526 [Lactarius deliciosus]|nr:hypothetical protein EDB83DRAFT_2520526 [Lactarius deliciosus]